MSEHPVVMFDPSEIDFTKYWALFVHGLTWFYVVNRLTAQVKAHEPDVVLIAPIGSDACRVWLKKDNFSAEMVARALGLTAANVEMSQMITLKSLEQNYPPPVPPTVQDWGTA